MITSDDTDLILTTLVDRGEPMTTAQVAHAVSWTVGQALDVLHQLADQGRVTEHAAADAHTNRVMWRFWHLTVDQAAAHLDDVRFGR